MLRFGAQPVSSSLAGRAAIEGRIHAATERDAASSSHDASYACWMYSSFMMQALEPCCQLGDRHGLTNGPSRVARTFLMQPPFSRDDRVCLRRTAQGYAAGGSSRVPRVRTVTPPPARSSPSSCRWAAQATRLRSTRKNANEWSEAAASIRPLATVLRTKPGKAASVVVAGTMDDDRGQSTNVVSRGEAVMLLRHRRMG